MRTTDFLNRELSWLEFNQRVLDMAIDASLPLLERLKFLCITTTNLDEFFMVRVGGLQTIAQDKKATPDPAGMLPQQQLDAIHARVIKFTDAQYTCFLNDILVNLAGADIRRVLPAEMTPEQQAHVEWVFENELFPILTPIAVEESSHLLHLINRLLHIAVRLKPLEDSGDKPRYAIVPIHKNTSRLVTLPAAKGHAFILIEDVIGLFLHRLFPGESIAECLPLRITRNADLSVREDGASDLLSEMEAVIDARRNSECVRLEIDARATKTLLGFLQKTLNVSDSSTYRFSGPIDLSAFFALTSLAGLDSLRFEPWPAQASPRIEPGIPLFSIIARGNVLLYHPFESYEPVVRLIQEAADDPDVLGIKQILYRTSRKSPIVSALIRAAEKGKYVTAIVELKARFDEERNMEWARELQDAGVQIIYGVKGLKTHAKVCLIVRREPQGIRRYIHFGTGNYNEVTAELYCDVSYLTCDEDLGSDASAFFNAITGYSQPQGFRKIDAAPIGLRESVVDMIEQETERKKQGQKAFIRAKLNALVDPKIIKALYTASQAGVRISLNVRGTCCLRPGVAGLSENITVISIVDRFLEHARLLWFHNGGEDRVCMSTADWMPRNLDKRIELLVPVEDSESSKRIMSIIDTSLQDTQNAWQLNEDGFYQRIAGKKKNVRSQQVMYEEACSRIEQARQLQRTVFEPYRPKEQ